MASSAEESGAGRKAKDKSHRFITSIPSTAPRISCMACPNSAISPSALERDGLLVAGVLFNPVTDDMYYAEKGHGAYLNNKRLRVWRGRVGK